MVYHIEITSKKERELIPHELLDENKITLHGIRIVRKTLKGMDLWGNTRVFALKDIKFEE